MRTLFLGEQWNKNHQTPAAKRRNVIARHVSAGKSGKRARVLEGRHEYSRTHFQRCDHEVFPSAVLAAEASALVQTPDPRDGFSARRSANISFVVSGFPAASGNCLAPGPI